MAHSHAHSDGEGEGNYFLDQLFTVLVCGALGLVAVLMYRDGMLKRILVPGFFVPVLVGGLAILAMVVIRAAAVWKLAGARNAAEAHGPGCGHDHGHAHTEDCGHDHGHSHSHAHDDHGHAHSHAEKAPAPVAAGDTAEEEHHDHGWAPWRYMILVIPVFLYFLNLPREGFSTITMGDGTSGSNLQQNPRKQALASLAGSPALLRVMRRSPGAPVTEVKYLTFKELSLAAASPGRHEFYEGEVGVIRGQFWPMKTSDRDFTLFRMNMTCCAADAVPLEVRIEAPDAIQGIKSGQWVSVKGVISFQRIEEKKKWIAVISLEKNDDIDPNAEATNDTEGL